jgi:hypothetical protein
MAEKNAGALDQALPAGYILAPGQAQLSQPLALRWPQPLLPRGWGLPLLVAWVTAAAPRASTEKNPAGKQTVWITADHQAARRPPAPPVRPTCSPASNSPGWNVLPTAELNRQDRMAYQFSVTV